MIIYADHLDGPSIQEALTSTGLHRDGVYLELHGPLGSRKRQARFVVKLSADEGRDRFGTKRRWANSGPWGAAAPSNGYVGEPLGSKAATFDEWGVFIAALFERDPEAIVGVYDSPDALKRAWTMPSMPADLPVRSSRGLAT
jgi:hypothetical protein